MRDELREAELRVAPGVRMAEAMPVHVAAQFEMHASILPRIDQLIGCDGDGRQRVRALAVHETEALRELRGDEAAKGYVVHEREEADRRTRLSGRGAPVHAAHHRHELPLDTDAPVAGD